MQSDNTNSSTVSGMQMLAWLLISIAATGLAFLVAWLAPLYFPNF